MINERLIGKRIKELRRTKGWSQAKLSSITGISITQLSCYENGRIPSLTNLAKISQALETSLDRLYFGDESEALISTAPDEGHMVVNCLAALFALGVFSDCRHIDSHSDPFPLGELDQRCVLPINRYPSAIMRLFRDLNETRSHAHTYADIDSYIKQIKESIAKEISE